MKIRTILIGGAALALVAGGLVPLAIATATAGGPNPSATCPVTGLPRDGSNCNGTGVPKLDGSGNPNGPGTGVPKLDGTGNPNSGKGRGAGR